MPASPIQVRVLGPHLHLFGPVFELRAPPGCEPQQARPRCRRPLSHTVLVSETTLAIELPGSDDLVVRRTTTQTVRSIKGSAAADRQPLSFLGNRRDDSPASKVAPAPGNDGLVFTSSEGRPLRRSNFIRRVWQPALRRPGSR